MTQPFITERAQSALHVIGKQSATWAKLRSRGVYHHALRELRDAGLAENDPTTRGDNQRWRLTSEGELLL